MQKNFRISIIAGLAIAIGVMIVPGSNIAPAALPIRPMPPPALEAAPAT